MTLLETIRAIERVAARQPAVKMIVENDVFKLNACKDALYGAFAFVQGTHSGSVDDALVVYNFSLFYVDRLTADRGNQIEVQSVGIETLTNILRELDEVMVVGTYTFQPFNQRFSDDCAGVYCSVSLQSLASPCGETFESDGTIKII